MTDPAIYDPVGQTGYSLAQLAAAFDRVMNPRDWKAPIRSVIPVDAAPVVEHAIRWFTGSEPSFLPSPGTCNRLEVIAPGYRLGSGATGRGALGGRAGDITLEGNQP